MKKLVALLAAALVSPLVAQADSTINSTNAYAYGANTGWMNWRPSTSAGVQIGEYVCSGWIYGANVGWINMGSGFPSNQIQYSNSSATDFGVNYMIEPTSPGLAKLRGLAYGANIGWINFEAGGNPRLRFSDGRMEGYAWSANCGWINLGDGTFAVQTDVIRPGLDSDSDGMADAFEFLHLGGLGANPNVDSDGDGTTDLEEYLNGTDPNRAGDRLQITQYQTNAGGTDTLLVWTSTAARLYQVEIKDDLLQPKWSTAELDIITPDAGMQTSLAIFFPSPTQQRFYRVRAIRPLLPPGAVAPLDATAAAVETRQR